MPKVKQTGSVFLILIIVFAFLLFGGLNQLRQLEGMPAFMNADEKARFCREHADVCRQATGSGNIHVAGPDMAAKCVQYGGTWTGTSCIVSTPPPPPTVSSGPTGVQGVSAIRILIQDLLSSFK